MVRRRVAGALVVLALAGCTVVGPDGDQTPTPGPTGSTPSESPADEAPAADPSAAAAALPQDATTVLDASGTPARALAMSTLVYASAPVVVVAPADDTDAQVRAASAAVALGVPLLLGGSTATADEVRRLGARAVLTVGDVPFTVPDDVTVVAAPEADDDLADLLDVDEVATAPAGAPLGAVMRLDRERPAILGGGADASSDGGAADDDTTGTEDADGGEDADSGAGDDTATGTQDADEGEGADSGATDDTATTADPTATGTATPSGEDEGTAAVLRTTLGDPLDDGLLLTGGAPDDLAATATARAAGIPVLLVPGHDPRRHSRVVQALSGSQATVIALGGEFGPVEDLSWKVATAATGVELPGGGQLVLPGKSMVALYGTPGSGALGVLGEQSARASVVRVKKLAAQYQRHTDESVVPAFEMIVTVASAGAGSDKNYSNEIDPETFVPWIEAAQKSGIYVILDLQPGRTDFLTQAKRYESLLRYPNVGLALDPEWRLKKNQVHLRQIGRVHVAEVNRVADWLADLTRENHLPQKLLVLHQFSLSMITDRQDLDTSHEEIALMIHVDGQGSQPAKNGTWRALRAGAPDVAWGWKNFFDEDKPMLTVEQTTRVRPRPELVTYQ